MISIPSVRRTGAACCARSKRPCGVRSTRHLLGAEKLEIPWQSEQLAQISGTTLGWRAIPQDFASASSALRPQYHHLPYCALLIGSAVADGADGADGEKSTREVIRILRFPSRPSRLKAISIPSVLRNA